MPYVGIACYCLLVLKYLLILPLKRDTFLAEFTDF
uniref:Uncharacterized protein n=1 Tax=Siphoviridae sp. ct96x5 TaxID=2825367 RepID=A0A8S5PQZ3_9CAUD|nr:MAG TPA: hypothetical protein [Siphoviridae sp. ct96x5]